MIMWSIVSVFKRSTCHVSIRPHVKWYHVSWPCVMTLMCAFAIRCQILIDPHVSYIHVWSLYGIMSTCLWWLYVILLFVHMYSVSCVVTIWLLVDIFLLVACQISISLHGHRHVLWLWCAHMQLGVKFQLIHMSVTSTCGADVVLCLRVSDGCMHFNAMCLNDVADCWYVLIDCVSSFY